MDLKYVSEDDFVLLVNMWPGLCTAYFIKKSIQREEDRANAEPCPKGKVEFKGQIINIKNQSSFYGTQTKMLVKSDTGFLAFGTLPRGLGDDNVQRGDRVQFTATFNPTEKDTKFGFFKRPTKAIFSRNI